MKANPMNDQVAMYFISIGILDIDKDGNIWRLKIKHKGGNYYAIKPYITGTKSPKGYLYVNLFLSDIHHMVFCHRIVWIFNNGQIPEELQVNHKNGIKHDNRLENLEIVTHKQNIRHATYVLGAYPDWSGSNNPRAILTEKEVLEIRSIYDNKNISQTDLGFKFGISQGTVNNIIHRRRWKHI